MLPRRRRPVERSLALAPVEAGEMSAREDRPDYAVAIDVEPARRESLHWRLRVVPGQLVDFSQSRRGRI